MEIESVAYTTKGDATIRINFTGGAFVFAPENGGMYQEQLAEWLENGGQIQAAPEQ